MSSPTSPADSLETKAHQPPPDYARPASAMDAPPGFEASRFVLDFPKKAWPLRTEELPFFTEYPAAREHPREYACFHGFCFASSSLTPIAPIKELPEGMSPVEKSKGDRTWREYELDIAYDCVNLESDISSLIDILETIVSEDNVSIFWDMPTSFQDYLKNLVELTKTTFEKCRLIYHDLLFWNDGKPPKELLFISNNLKILLDKLSAKGQFLEKCAQEIEKALLINPKEPLFRTRTRCDCIKNILIRNFIPTAKSFYSDQIFRDIVETWLMYYPFIPKRMTPQS
jgi:hypothetical protein